MTEAWWQSDPIISAPAAGANWWQADPILAPAPAAAPAFGSDEYVNALAKKHGIDPEHVRGLAQSQVASQAFKGVPVLGAGVDKAAGYISALAQPLTGAGAPGASIGERAAKNQALEQEIAADFEKAHPALSTASQLIGGTLALGPLGETAIGAKVLGLTGRTLPGQIARGATSGLAINAADAVARGQDPTTAGEVGAGIGGAVPVVGRIAGAVAQPVVNAIRGAINPGEEALRRVAGAVDRDIQAGSSGLSPQEFVTASQAGAPVNLMDVGGETTRALARSAANTSPEGRAVLNRAIDDRFEGQTGRLTDWLNQTFHYPNVTQTQAAIDNLERTTNQAAYQRAYRAGAQGVWSPDLERLTSSPAVVEAMRGAVDRGGNRAVAAGMGGFNPGVTFDNGMINFRRGPTGVPAYPDLQFWDYTQRNLRDASQAAFRQGRNEEGGALSALHRQLLSTIDAAVPEFGAARAGASRFFGAENALEAGQNFASPSAKLGNRDARLAVAQMNPQERQLFQDGFVDRFIRQLNETGDRRNVVSQIAQSPAARERLDIALGPQRSAELQGMLHVEGIMDLARGAVQGNSSTARQLYELGFAGGAGTLMGGGNPLDPSSVMTAALLYGAARGRTAIDARVARQVAQLLTSNDPRQLANGMRILGRSQNLMGALRNADVALARVGASEITNRQPVPAIAARSGVGAPTRTPPPAAPQGMGL